MAGQKTAHIFRLIYVILFVYASLMVVFSIESTLLDLTQLFNIFDYIMLLVQSLVSLLGQAAFIVVRSIISLKQDIPLIGTSVTSTTGLENTLVEILKPENKLYPNSAIDLSNAEQALEDLGNFIGAIVILALIPIAFLSGIGFLREGDAKLAIYSFLGFQLMIIVAILTEHIKIPIEINSSSLIAMITSPVFTLGFLLYLLLEMAFQTSYALNIIGPMTDREKRINENLKRIKTFVPKVEVSGESAIQSVQAKKHGILAASYLREIVEKRMFKKGERQLDDKSMMRLQSFLENMARSDPKIEEKLAAKTAQPDTSALIKHFIPTMIFRIILVVVLSYLIVSPDVIVRSLFKDSFPALLDSLELRQPEFSTIAILNIVLIFVLLSFGTYYLSKGRETGLTKRVVQQIETLVEFDRESGSVTTAPGASEEETEEGEDEEEEIS